MATSTKQDDAQFDAMSDTSSTTFRVNTPPTTMEAPEDLWGERGAIPWPENTFQIIEKQSGGAVSILGDEAKLLRDHKGPSDLSTQWLCVKQDGYFGFQNPPTGRYLGHDGKARI
ncbi:hypothetical protein F5883DRAFT_255911 [Diaporthe sp. PMI_573]|nr:hypothetical protein F5883DRAFT_255911 [Diaporthaceae sp. PMI_573]